MIWFLILCLILIACWFASSYATTNDSSFMSFSAWIFGAAILFAAFNFIVETSDKDPLKSLTHIQKYELIEKCMNNPECSLEKLIGIENVRN